MDEQSHPEESVHTVVVKRVTPYKKPIPPDPPRRRDLFNRLNPVFHDTTSI